MLSFLNSLMYKINPFIIIFLIDLPLVLLMTQNSQQMLHFSEWLYTYLLYVVNLIKRNP